MLYKDGRIAGVQSTIDTDVVPHLASTPWDVSSLVVDAGNVGLLSFIDNQACPTAKLTALSTSTALTTCVDVTGSGYLDVAAINQAVATSTTLKLVITVDGVEICNYTTAAAATQWRALVALGNTNDSNNRISGEHPVYFRSSLKVEAQQSASVSARVLVRYRLAAPHTA